jgi:uncharacterized repeat protein (TIGR01451 family)
VGSLAPSATQTFTITVHINPAATGPVINTATVTATNPTEDTNPANNSSTATTTVQRLADLGITKTAPATANEGTDVSYTLTVTNNGPSASSGGTVRDELPAGVTFVSASAGCTNAAGVVTCSFGTLLPGVSVTFSITLHIAGCGAISNTATVTATSPTEDIVLSNNAATANTTVPCLAGKVTGGGEIRVPVGPNGKDFASFGFVAQRRTTDGPVTGSLQYYNHARQLNVHSLQLLTLAIDHTTNTATFTGTCLEIVGGGPRIDPCIFTVTVQDNAEPGQNRDMFTIVVTGPTPETAGSLTTVPPTPIIRGNIQVH